MKKGVIENQRLNVNNFFEEIIRPIYEAVLNLKSSSQNLNHNNLQRTNK